MPKSPILPLAAAVTAVALGASPALAAPLSPGKRDEAKAVAFPLLAVKGQAPAGVGSHVSHSSHVSGSGAGMSPMFPTRLSRFVGPCPGADDRGACRAPAGPAAGEPSARPPAPSLGASRLTAGARPSEQPVEQPGGRGEHQPGRELAAWLRVRPRRAVRALAGGIRRFSRRRSSR